MSYVFQFDTPFKPPFPEPRNHGEEIANAMAERDHLARFSVPVERKNDQTESV